MTIQDVFQRITSAFDRAGIEYMLSGSFAAAYYGAARSTQDIDFVIHATGEQLRSFIAALPSNDYYADLDSALEAQRKQSMFNVIDHATGWKVDVIVRKSRPYSRTEFQRRERISLHGVGLFVVTAEDAVISKLEWAKLADSSRQLQDVAAILKAQGEKLDQPYLQKWILELGLGEEWKQAERAAGVP